MPLLYRLGCLCLFGLNAYAQDPQFSQYYALPLYLNPAYAGYGNGIRANAIYRNQWRDLGQYNTFAASADVPYACGRLKLGGGVLLMNDRQSSTVETLNGGITLVPAVLEGDQYSARLGVYLGAGQRSYRRDGLTFMDQLTTTGTLNPTQDPFATASLSRAFFDVGVGGLIDFSFTDSDEDDKDASKYGDMDWIGISVSHINQPRIEMGAGVPTYRLPMHISLHAGSRLGFGAWSVTPLANFRMQGSLRQLDFGVYTGYYQFVLGLLYRGVPLSRQLVGQPTQDALVALVGIQSNGFSVGFSYDATISGLTGYTGNSFEFSLRLRLTDFIPGCPDGKGKPNGKGARKQLSCPQ
ncbi:PorP/SprF family type IX secretion system membrane protein [Fibrella aquatilis]|uniref:PorP/SprF family type IX secretion system membrane protein n=1 Tax=Fibrella aquatilis TaxID=2817059 RepID=A0A939JY19_9BACT|nr:PorP/SprF family type IX secretion system membrane protein [Fibrella aquatilis]MBO0929888.1 PorP/SprF family type IX secretion system membrane protein [Fibrella aquatilis]